MKTQRILGKEGGIVGCRIKCAESEDNHMCCLECPDFDDCPVQCEFLDEYEFVEDCPDYVKENEDDV